MSKVPTGGLSSNWKNLQKSLKRKTPEGGEQSPKQKSSSQSTSSANIPSKRVKLTSRSDKKTMADATSSKPPPNGKKLVLKMTAIAKSQKTSAISTETTASSTSTTLSSRKATIAWAKENDLDPSVVTEAYSEATTSDPILTTSQNSAKASEAGRYIAIDCEMVGVGGPLNEQSALARVSLVNYNGVCVLDTFVKPKERVTDWRTWVSGVRPKDMANALTLEEAQQKIHEFTNGKILIGHAIHHDLEAMFLSHPKRDIRDTARHQPFRVIAKQKSPGLKRLAKEVLGLDIQGAAHSSVEDAKVTMMLYRKEKKEFERLAVERFGLSQKGKQKQMPRGQGKKRRKKQQKESKKGEGVVNGVVVADVSTKTYDGSEDETSGDDGGDFDDWLA